MSSFIAPFQILRDHFHVLPTLLIALSDIQAALAKLSRAVLLLCSEIVPNHQDMYFPAFPVSHDLTHKCRLATAALMLAVFLRMICDASVNRMRGGAATAILGMLCGERRESRGRERRGEGRISIEFLLHGGAEHNSRGKASIAISNAPMSRTRTERKADADGRRTVLGLSGKIARGGNHGGCGLYAA